MINWAISKIASNTWEAPSLIFRICPHLSQPKLRSVMDDISLKDHRVEDFIPLSSKREPDHYEGFVRLFNTVTEMYRQSVSNLDDLLPSPRKEPFYSESDQLDLPMEQYNREVAGPTFMGYKLKPDLIIPPTVVNAAEGPTKITVVGEVKDNLPAMVAQSATYARALLGAHPSRAFAAALAYKHDTSQVRLLIFHRSGVHSTLPARLVNGTEWDSEGCTQFVEIVACLKELCSGRSGWIDPEFLHRSSNATTQSLFPPVTVAPIHVWTSILGRATQVVRLNFQPPPSNVSQNKLAAIPATDLNTSAKRGSPSEEQSDSISERVKKRRRETPESLSNRPPVPPSLIEQKTSFDASGSLSVTELTRFISHCWNHPPPQPNNPTPQLPSTIIAKVAHPSWMHLDEADVFRDMGKEMGLPVLLEAFHLDDNAFLYGGVNWEAHKQQEQNHVPAEDGEAVKEDGVVDEDNKDIHWPIFNSEWSPFPEKRVRCVMMFAKEGIPLENATSVRHLFVGIVHGMLGLSVDEFILTSPAHPIITGHCNIWEQKGMLHRDVSDNNIMLLRAVEYRKPVQKYVARFVFEIAWVDTDSSF
jgi:hypothetical protein